MHIEKYNLSVGKIEIGHDLRTHKEYKNKDIDFTLSHSNYHFNEVAPMQRLEERINEIYIYGKNGKHKDDINYLVSVCVQYPENCSVDEETFFILMDKVFTNRFGKDNKICSCVHLDEKGKSHLHYKFMPVVYNGKKNRYELCAKKVVNRQMLMSFHKDIENDLLALGYNIKLHDPENHVKGQNIDDIEEYKKYKEHIKQLEEKIAELEKGIIDRENKINDLNVKGRAMVEKYNSLVDKFDSLKIEFDEMQEEIKKYLNDDMNLDEKINFNRKYNIDEIVR
ncbi:MAG: plasmid recombination protein [Clostridia bacterium]|nr:plasmid recombination protein [Clostridia bacterium]